MMTGGTGDIPVAGQDLVVKEQLTEFGLFLIEGEKIVVRQRRGQFCCLGSRDGRKQKGEGKQPMKWFVAMAFAAVAVAVAFLPGPARAEIEAARDMMEAGQFEEARKALWPAARSGNADAEELIGVMYAMGLGVERDDQRAFEWYLRSAMKGHPGAQSGVGWYYEVGRGLPSPDLVRAYMWYTLSAIGGDPDAAISLEEVVKKMTREDIEKAHVLVSDYKVWMYPFR